MRRELGAALVCGLMALGISGKALAGGPGLKDEGYRAPSWTGFYLGIHGGWGGGPVDWTFTGNTRSDHTASGVFGGGQIGYNQQIGGLVLGVEADGGWAGIQGDAACPNPSFRCGTTVNALGSVRGRIGALVGPQSLFYATGGWGWANVKYEAVPNSPGGFANTVNLSGYTLGGGIEWALAPRTSLKVEYLGYFFGDQHHSSAPLIGGIDADPTIHTVKLGVNYRF